MGKNALSQLIHLPTNVLELIRIVAIKRRKTRLLSIQLMAKIHMSKFIQGCSWVIPRYGLLFERNMSNIIKVLGKVVKVLPKK
jgi:hypothetical protein